MSPGARVRSFEVWSSWRALVRLGVVSSVEDASRENLRWSGVAWLMVLGCWYSHGGPGLGPCGAPARVPLDGRRPVNNRPDASQRRRKVMERYLSQHNYLGSLASVYLSSTALRRFEL